MVPLVFSLCKAVCIIVEYDRAACLPYCGWEEGMKEEESWEEKKLVVVDEEP